MSQEKIPIQIRAPENVRQLIDRAASTLGKTRTEFMIDSARSTAEDVLLDRRTFFLGKEDWDAVIAELDKKPSSKIIELIKEKPVWEK